MKESVGKKRYRTVFTNIHTHMDMVGEASEDIVIDIIQDMLNGGKLMLSELTLIEPDNA